MINYAVEVVTFCQCYMVNFVNNTSVRVGVLDP